MLPSCAARQMALICGHRDKKLPSCVARQMAMICGHEIKKLLSCVARQMAMICGHQDKMLLSCAARRMAMIWSPRQNVTELCSSANGLDLWSPRQKVTKLCSSANGHDLWSRNQKVTELCSSANGHDLCREKQHSWCSGNGGHLIQSFDNKGLQSLGGTQFLFGQCDDQVISSKIRPGLTLGHKINGKFSSKSCTQPCKASINYTLDCDYLAGATCTENTHPPRTHLDKALPVNKANTCKKRKRDREPSRIPVNRGFTVLKRKKLDIKLKIY